MFFRLITAAGFGWLGLGLVACQQADSTEKSVVTAPATQTMCYAPDSKLGQQTASKPLAADKMKSEPPKGPKPAGMAWIPAGQYQMGTNDEQSFPNERPAHDVRLAGFWMDEHEVTNAEFARFVAATGYKTTAERPVDWEQLKTQLPPGTPKPPEANLAPGAMVFTPPSQPVPLDDYTVWWHWVPGASWRHPEGPGSTLKGRENHPVVQVSWDDATAYARWAGKRLPTEAEWEWAARGGLAAKRFTWGDAPPTEKQANIWQGNFPNQNTKADGYVGTAPIKSFAANNYGLYDMAGNVWEWCADWYRADEHIKLASLGQCENPDGPKASFDPDEPTIPKRVTKGGSFLCHVSYCESYRPSARRGTAFDSGMSHVGFRCVR
ncbi:formylglycine-generating enzyme family protein [Hymenobacter cavernae]|uniref:formylglycine-generating enzyme family protein n=1 Tax=Hymenobacter cavernae TaxID=2044852 RepID=UPI001E3AE927|nr:formylglycine-generating enzyme family protein [Hymenobacter cavernae]